MLCDVWHSQAWFLYVRLNFESSDRFFERYSAPLNRSGMVLPGHWAMGHREEHHDARHVTGDTTLLKEALRWFAESHDLFAAAGRQRFAYGDMAVCHLDLETTRSRWNCLKNCCRNMQKPVVHGYQVTIANIGNVYRHREITYGRSITIATLSNARRRSKIPSQFASGHTTFGYHIPCFANPLNRCAQRQPECKLESCSFLESPAKASPTRMGLIFLFLIPLEDTRPVSAQAAYDHAGNSSSRGDWRIASKERNRDTRSSRPPTRNGQLNSSSLKLKPWCGAECTTMLCAFSRITTPLPIILKKPSGSWRSKRALWLTRDSSPPPIRNSSRQKISAKARITNTAALSSRRAGIWRSDKETRFARRYYLDALTFAQTHHDRSLEANASLNLGFVALQIGHFGRSHRLVEDRISGWLRVGAEGTAQLASGNLGWAYFELAITKRRWSCSSMREDRCKTRDIRDELRWINNAGAIYDDTGDLTALSRPTARRSHWQGRLIARKTSQLHCRKLPWFW